MRIHERMSDTEVEQNSGNWRTARFVLGVATGLCIAAIVVGALSVDMALKSTEIAGQGPAPTEAAAPSQPSPEPATETEAAQAPAGDTAATGETVISQEPAGLAEPASSAKSEDTGSSVVTSQPPAEPEVTDQLAAKAPVDPLPAVEPGNAATTETGASGDGSSLPAWERNAVAVNLPADTPRIALVLENPENSDIPHDLILGLGLPVTMGISPIDNPAIAFGEKARSAGFEIVARLPLLDRRDPASTADVIHPAMSAAEIEAAVQRLLQGMPQAVAVSGVGGRQVASNAGLIEAVMLALKPEGYAFLDDSGQRNAVAVQIAQRLDTVALGDVRVASGAMTDDQVYRLLDAAAQAAETTGAVVVAAPASAAVLIGLQRWALERNGKPARLVPLSAVLSIQ